MTARTLTFAGYAVLAGAAVLLELVARRRGGVNLGAVLRWLTARWPGRVVLLLGWAWLGWHLFVRGSAPFLR